MFGSSGAAALMALGTEVSGQPSVAMGSSDGGGVNVLPIGGVGASCIREGTTCGLRSAAGGTGSMNESVLSPRSFVRQAASYHLMPSQRHAIR